MIYNSHIAKHYKSYRPELHKLVLEKCFSDKVKYKLALDIGCGVGHSSEALLPYCDAIIGIDNSDEMLSLAQDHEHISYSKSNLPQLAVADGSVDLITFAGSLFYCKSQEILDECLRVLKNNGDILIYDFNVHLNDIVDLLVSKSIASDYDHAIDFGGLDLKGLNKIKSEIFNTSINLEIENLIHLLQADQGLVDALTETYEMENIETTLLEELNIQYPSGHVRLDVDIYIHSYVCKRQ